MRDYDRDDDLMPRNPQHPGQFKLFAYTILLYAGLIAGFIGTGAIISLCISLGALAGEPEERVATSPYAVHKSVDS